MTKELNNTSNRQKIDSLQVIRAIAFFGIFMFHFDIGGFGAWGVSVFIILSGFLMTYSYFERELNFSILQSFRFSVKKVSRLYGLHVFLIILLFVLGLPLLLHKFTTAKLINQCVLILINLILVQDWIPVDRIYFGLNSVAWYLSLCVFLYFAFPFILRFIKKLKSIKQSIIISVIIFSIQCLIGVCLYFSDISFSFLDSFPKWITYVFPIFRLGDFIIGCCFGYVFLKKKRTISAIVSSLAEVLVLICILVSYYLYNSGTGILGSDAFRFNMIYTISSVGLVYLFAENKGVLSKVLTCKPLIYLGNISPYAFLIHLPIMKYIGILLNRIFNIHSSKYLCAACGFVLTIIFSEIYRRLDKKIREKLKERKECKKGEIC